MPNIVRNFSKGGFYHIYNRGNHRQAVFLEDFDYQYYLQLVDQGSLIHEVEIIAYCVMRNHYHFIVRQLTDNDCSISEWISSVTMSYTHYFNKKYNQVGRLYQGVFRSKVILTDEYLVHLSKYIHGNPSEFTDPLRYRWSSVHSYLYNIANIANPAYILKLLNGCPYELDRSLPSHSLRR